MKTNAFSRQYIWLKNMLSFIKLKEKVKCIKNL